MTFTSSIILTPLLLSGVCWFCFDDHVDRLFIIIHLYELTLQLARVFLVLRLYSVFFFSMSLCNTCFKISNLEKRILKYLKKNCLSSFRRPNGVMKFSFLLPCSEHLINPVFSFFNFYSSARRQTPQAMVTSSSQQSTPTVKSGSSALQKRRSVKLLDLQFGYFRLPPGLSRRTRHFLSMAGARHGMCDSTAGQGNDVGAG
jgi:hypothetical protein